MVTAPVPGDGEFRLQLAACPVAFDSVPVVLLTVTVEPMSCIACVASEVCCSEIRVCRLVFSLICCSTEANSTSCSVNWLVSIGSSGSWFCNCVVSNCKNVSKLPAICCVLAVLAACAALEGLAAVDVETVVMAVPQNSSQ